MDAEKIHMKSQPEVIGILEKKNRGNRWLHQWQEVGRKLRNCSSVTWLLKSVQYKTHRTPGISFQILDDKNSIVCDTGKQAS